MGSQEQPDASKGTPIVSGKRSRGLWAAETRRTLMKMCSSQAPTKASASEEPGCSHLFLWCQASQQCAHLLGQQGFLPHCQLGQDLQRDALSPLVCLESQKQQLQSMGALWHHHSPFAGKDAPRQGCASSTQSWVRPALTLGARRARQPQPSQSCYRPVPASGRSWSCWLPPSGKPGRSGAGAVPLPHSAPADPRPAPATAAEPPPGACLCISW